MSSLTTVPLAALPLPDWYEVYAAEFVDHVVVHDAPSDGGDFSPCGAGPWAGALSRVSFHTAAGLFASGCGGCFGNERLPQVAARIAAWDSLDRAPRCQMPDLAGATINPAFVPRHPRVGSSLNNQRREA